ncbi:MAG: N-acetylmuramoyl-L-alanine amidase [Deltaproteobacteria bacterium]|nr:N-acetylmuramoyl-L-alanine amidase [Deltaproteobacteria bacterium]
MARTDETDDRRGRRCGLLLAVATLSLLAWTVEAAAVAVRPGRVERVRYEARDGSTRVIIMLSRPVPFEVRVLGGETARKTERRIVLDFSNAVLAPGAAAPIGVENGFLQQVRTGQFTARTARVVLDLASITKHSVEAFEDPPRVVIDIVGKPAPAAPVVAAPNTAPSRTEGALATTRGEPPAERTTPSADRAAPPREVATAPPSPPERASVEPPRASGHAGEPAKPLDKSDKGTPAALDRVTIGDTAERRSEPAPVPAASPKRPETAGKAGSTDPLPGRPANRPWRIVLDPGHGGADPGAQGVGGIVEKDIVLAIAQRLKRRLEESSNAKVLLTRETDATRTLAERTAFANANSADLFISIHANADRSGELQGIETYTLNNSNDRATIRLAKMENGPAVRVGRGDLSFILSDMVQSGKEEESNALAERLHSRVLARLRSRYTDVHNLGVKKGPFYVLVGAYMPCVLVETSFLSHPVEGKRLGTTAYQHDIAEGLFLGITDFLGDARLAKTL